MHRPADFRLARLLCAAALLGSGAGCEDTETFDSDPGAWEFPGWEPKEDALSDGLNRTRDASARVFVGFNAVTDSSVGEHCVVPRTGPVDFAPFRAGGEHSDETLEYIESLDELQTALNIDATAQVKAGPLGVKASVGFTEEFASSETALSILLRSSAAYTVINQDQLELTDEARALANSDPAAFVRKCGTHFIGGVEYGAELRLLITIETNSLEEKESVRTALEAEGLQAGAATVGASLSTEFSEVLKSKAVTVTARSETVGFNPSKSLAALNANPLDPSAMALAQMAVGEMKASLARDMCNDQGESAPGGQCDGHAALGYLHNGGRSAQPTGVQIRDYRAAADFPDDPDSIDAFGEQRRLAETALAYIDRHARAFNTVARVYNEEVGAMLASPTPYNYAIYDRDDTFLWWSEQELRGIAETMALGFDPVDGSMVRIIEDSLRKCWDRAESGDFSGCAGKPELRGVDALLDSYALTRIRPIYYTLSADAVAGSEAADTCAAGSRLPNKYEATRLLTALKANSAVPAPVHDRDRLEQPWALWVADEYGDCDADEATYVEIGETAGAQGCDSENAWVAPMRLPALCVPNAGPYGARVFEL